MTRIIVTNLESFLDYTSEHWIDLELRACDEVIEVKHVRISPSDKDRVLEAFEKLREIEYER